MIGKSTSISSPTAIQLWSPNSFAKLPLQVAVKAFTGEM
jgi:hypothetical protein